MSVPTRRMSMRTEPYINHSLVVLDVAEDLETAELPLAAFGRVDRGNLQTAVDRGRLVIDELDCPLSSTSVCVGPCNIRLVFLGRTAML